MHHTFKAKRNLASFGLSLESIDFQQDNFGSQLEAILYGAEKFAREAKGSNNDVREQLQMSDFPKMLADIIFKRLGIKTNVVFYTHVCGCVASFVANEHHVLTKPQYLGAGAPLDHLDTLRKLKQKPGTVDLKHAKIGGIFSEYLHDLYCDIFGNLIIYKMTVPEVTSIILHELGHVFTFYEFADRMETTNQVLANLSKEIRKNDNSDEAKKEYYIKEALTEFGATPEIIDDILNENKQVILGIKLFKQYIVYMKSQLPNSAYDNTAAEQLADNFAARFGYGRQLVTILDKFDYEETRMIGVLSFIEFIDFAIYPSLWALASMSMFGSLFIAFGLFVVVFRSTLNDYGAAYKDMRYDDMRARYVRVRQQYIEMIHKLNLPKDRLQTAINNIHAMDVIIKRTGNYKSIMEKLANFIFSVHRTTNDSVEMQYLLEEITHNNLFLKSAELQVLS